MHVSAAERCAELDPTGQLDEQPVLDVLVDPCLRCHAGRCERRRIGVAEFRRRRAQVRRERHMHPVIVGALDHGVAPYDAADDAAEPAGELDRLVQLLPHSGRPVRVGQVVRFPRIPR